MKKILLFFWNGFFDIIYFIKRKFLNLVFWFKDFLYTLKNKAPQIMSNEQTVNYILENNCSVTRFGDGEIKLYSGLDIYFQKANPKITKAYGEIFSKEIPKLLVCLPSVFDKKQRKIYEKKHRRFWKEHMYKFRKAWYRELNFNRIYGNAFISRPYICLEDKTTGIKEYFELVKKIWENNDIVVIEGEKSRLGMGNDLFSNAKSVRRILCPSAQCFDKYDEILAETKTYPTDTLFILAIGPSATILAYDLCKCGYQAIDMGNIDTEYEWFKMNAKQKVPIKDKMVYEAGAGAGVGEVDDEEYLSQIIKKIL